MISLLRNHKGCQYLLRSSGFMLRLANRCLGMDVSFDSKGRPLHSSVNLSHYLLKVVRPEQPNSTSSFRGVLQIPVSLLLRGNLRSTATSAPSLKSAHPERLPDKVPVSPDFQHPRQFFFFTFSLSLLFFSSLSPRGTKTPGVAGAPPYPALLTPLLFALHRGSTPPQCPVFDVMQSDGRSCNLPRDLQSGLLVGLSGYSASCLLVPKTQLPSCAWII
jgi:hypothetical protein